MSDKRQPTLADVLQDRVGALMNKIAPAMYIEQNRPTLQGIIDAMASSGYAPGPRESHRAYMYDGRGVPPDVAATFMHLVGEYDQPPYDGTILPGPR